VNLAGNPDYADVLRELRARTDAFVQAYGGPLEPLRGAFTPSTEPHPVAAALVGAKPDADGWVRMHDGRSLRGWTGDSKLWKVADGAITGQTDGNLSANSFLTWTFNTVQNFELRAQVRISARGNSGIQYRGQPRPDLGLYAVSGYQCDVVPLRADYNGMLYEEKGRRILAHAGERVIIDPQGHPWVVGNIDVPEISADGWHEYRVLARANHLRHWIDGHLIVDVIDLDEQHRAAEGVVAVQVHVGPPMQVQFKDLRIRHLPDDLPVESAADHPIPASARGVRPQGKLPADWQPPIYGERDSP
ncbi:MAG: DUF1080 domain-containing protein, partial [Planctomycetota bacterium]